MLGGIGEKTEVLEIELVAAGLGMDGNIGEGGHDCSKFLFMKQHVLLRQLEQAERKQRRRGAKTTLLNVQFLVLFDRNAAMVPFAEKRRTQL